MPWECWGRKKRDVLLDFLVKFNELLRDVDKEINGVNFVFFRRCIHKFINMRNSLEMEASSLCMCQWLTLLCFSAQIRNISQGLGDNSRFLEIHHWNSTACWDKQKLIHILKIPFVLWSPRLPALCFCSLNSLIHSSNITSFFHKPLIFIVLETSIHWLTFHLHGLHKAACTQ